MNLSLFLDQLGWAKRADLAVLEVNRGDDRMPVRKWLKLQPGDTWSYKARCRSSASC